MMFGRLKSEITCPCCKKGVLKESHDGYKCDTCGQDFERSKLLKEFKDCSFLDVNRLKDIHEKCRKRIKHYKEADSIDDIVKDAITAIDNKDYKNAYQKIVIGCYVWLVLSELDYKLYSKEFYVIIKKGMSKDLVKILKQTKECLNNYNRNINKTSWQDACDKALKNCEDIIKYFQVWNIKFNIDLHMDGCPKKILELLNKAITYNDENGKNLVFGLQVPVAKNIVVAIDSINTKKEDMSTLDGINSNTDIYKNYYDKKVVNKLVDSIDKNLEARKGMNSLKDKRDLALKKYHDAVSGINKVVNNTTEIEEKERQNIAEYIENILNGKISKIDNSINNVSEQINNQFASANSLLVDKINQLIDEKLDVLTNETKSELIKRTNEILEIVQKEQDDEDSDINMMSFADKMDFCIKHKDYQNAKLKIRNCIEKYCRFKTGFDPTDGLCWLYNFGKLNPNNYDKFTYMFGNSKDNKFISRLTKIYSGTNEDIHGSAIEEAADEETVNKINNAKQFIIDNNIFEYNKDEAIKKQYEVHIKLKEDVEEKIQELKDGGNEKDASNFEQQLVYLNNNQGQRKQYLDNLE